MKIKNPLFLKETKHVRRQLWKCRWDIKNAAIRNVVILTTIDTYNNLKHCLYMVFHQMGRYLLVAP